MLFRILRLLLFFFSFSNALLYANKFDSLIQISKSTNLIQRTEALLSLSEYFATTDSLKSLNYLEQTDLFVEFPFDSTFIRLLNKKVEVYNKLRLKKHSEKILHQALKKAENLKDTLQLAEWNQQLARHYYYQFNYDKVRIHQKEAKKFYSILNNKNALGLVILQQGALEYAQGNYEDAIRLAFESIDIFRSIGMLGSLARSYHQLGNIYYFLTSYHEAAEYYRLSIEKFYAAGDSLGAAHGFSNLGLILIEQDSFKQALEIHNRILPILLRSGREISIGNAYHYLAEAHQGLKNYDSARHYFNQSLQINTKTDFKSGLIYDYVGLAEIALSEIDFKLAKSFIDKAEKVNESIDSKEATKELAFLKSSYYDSINKPLLAYQNLLLYFNLQDSLDYDPSALSRIAIKEKEKLVKAEMDLNLSEARAENAKSENSIQRKFLIGLTIFAILAVLLVIFLSVSNKKNRELNQELSKSKALIERELEIKKSLLKEIHHRVKNNLQIISSMLSIQSQYLEDDRLNMIITECRNRIVSMSLIHESLYKKEDEEPALFSHYIKELVPQLVSTYRLDQQKIDLEMDIEDLELSLDDSVPCGLIINEIVSNALKHAFPKKKNGIISIKMKKEQEVLKLRIADNGIGFTHGFDPESQDSFGFLLIYSLISQLEATMKIDSENGVAYQIEWVSKSDKLLC